MELQSIINDAGTTRPIVEITVQPFGSSEGGEQCFEVENVGICTGHAFAVEQAASFTDKGSSSTCKNKGVETPTIQLKPIYPMENENRIDLSLFDGNFDQRVETKRCRWQSSVHDTHRSR